MKNIAVAFLFCLTSTIANAQIGNQFRQVPKNILCGPIESIFKALLNEDINEKPIWTGRNEEEKTDYAVFVNQKTGSFTILQFGKEWGCILGLGTKSQQIGNITKSL